MTSKITTVILSVKMGQGSRDKVIEFDVEFDESMSNDEIEAGVRQLIADATSNAIEQFHEREIAYLTNQNLT